MDINALQTALTPLLQERPLAAAYVFGSFIEGAAHSESDIDIAVLPDNSFDGDKDALLVPLAADIARTLHISDRKVDISLLTDLPLPLRFKVENHGKLLFTRDEELLREEILRTAAIYHDQQPYIKAANERFAQSLRDGL